MKRQRTRDTAIEISVRSILHRASFRFRKNYPVPGIKRRTIDIAFPKRQIAVFIDGCYWHGCKVHRSIPKHNEQAWLAKLSENRARDEDTDRHLNAAGWTVLRYWEHSGASAIARDVLLRIAEENDGGTVGQN